MCVLRVENYEKWRRISERAWAAGFFDGEGYVRLWVSRKGAARDPERVYSYVKVGVGQSETSTLERFQEAVEGRGKIYGPYIKGGLTKKPTYKFEAHGGEAIEIIRLLQPYLSTLKLRKAMDVLREAEEHSNYRERHPLKRGPVTEVELCA